MRRQNDFDAWLLQNREGSVELFSRIRMNSRNSLSWLLLEVLNERQQSVGDFAFRLYWPRSHIDTLLFQSREEVVLTGVGWRINISSNIDMQAADFVGTCESTLKLI